MTACHGTRMSADADVSRVEAGLTCNVMQCSSFNYWLPKLSSGSGNANNYQDISLVAAQCNVSVKMFNCSSDNDSSSASDS